MEAANYNTRINIYGICKLKNRFSCNIFTLDKTPKGFWIDERVSCKSIGSIFIFLRCSADLSNMSKYYMADFMKETEPKAVCVFTANSKTHNNFIFIVERSSVQKRAADMWKKNKVK